MKEWNSSGLMLSLLCFINGSECVLCHTDDLSACYMLNCKNCHLTDIFILSEVYIRIDVFSKFNCISISFTDIAIK